MTSQRQDVPRRLAALVLALALSACVGNVMFRGAESVEEGDGFAVAFVELDDLGELWEPSQVTRALARIDAANAHPNGAIVVVFVHGWNHNAAENDSNVEGFRAQLRGVVETERIRRDAPPRPVVGVYVSWRGKTSKLLPLRLLSFFGRRGAAERVASLATTETVYRLITDAKRNPRSRVVLIGHSFGGAILEEALSQALVGFLLQQKGEDVDFPADLVVLVNPASQALRAKQFVEILARHRLRLYRTSDDGSFRFERPLIVSLTSSGDWATGIAFPLGLGAKGLGKNFRSYGSEYCNTATPQRRYYRQTAGHTRELLSHRVLAEPLAKPRERPLSAEEMAVAAQIRYDPISRLQSFEIDGSRLRFTIQRLAGAFNDTPYWIMRVPTSVMPDHGHIFGPDVQELLRALIIVTGSIEPSARTVMVHEHGVRPLGMARRVDGGAGVLFLDRSRRIYRITPGAATEFFACLPPAAAAVENSVGFQQQDRTVLLGRSGDEFGEGEGREVEVLRMRLLDDDAVIDERFRVDVDAQPAVVAFDVRGLRAFLASRDEPRLSVARLDARQASAEPLASLGGLSSIALLLYEPAGDQLFASDGVGTVVRFALGKDDGPTEIVADGLEFPTALAFDPERRRLYVATRGRRLWAYDCPGRCGPGRVFAEAAALIHPTSLVITADGVVWAGDAVAQTILCFSPEGELLSSHDELPAE